MRRALCQLLDPGTVTVQMRDSARTFRGGDLVDLDAVAVPATADRPAATWADVLGDHVQLFDLEKPVAERGSSAKGTTVAAAAQPDGVQTSALKE